MTITMTNIIDRFVDYTLACEQALLAALAARREKEGELATTRAVNNFLSSRLKMNSSRLWNSHQRHKFLRAEASRDILKIRVSEMAFAGVFKRYFPP